MKKILLFLIIISSNLLCQKIIITELINPSIHYNTISVGNYYGACVGICPPSQLPAELQAMNGTYNPQSESYGNYQVKVDNSIMVYIPALQRKQEKPVMFCIECLLMAGLYRREYLLTSTVGV